MAKAKHEYGFVYVASTNILYEKGIFKVGSTNDLARRLRDLSAKSSSPEKFEPMYFVRCDDPESAEILEKAVHAKLDEKEYRYTPNREFFETKDVLPIVRCILETAQCMEIPIVKQDYCEEIDMLEKEPSIPLPADRLLELDDIPRQAYKRAARDFSQLLFIFCRNYLVGNAFSSDLEKENYKKLISLISGINVRLNSSLETKYIENTMQLDLIFIEAMMLVYGRESVEEFQNIKRAYIESGKENEDYFVEPQYLEELKRELRKHKSRIQNNR